ncbi:FYVE, RhoGEF and PH domain-containing protein 2-like [Tubulanus polymorphus]|uniref:FYVE, RhoGEF and PH domain-containing protein 2-like n=1 Tax=Tubulanus polymorphus TaxID=672921 RepID=UPI003DA30520
MTFFFSGNNANANAESWIDKALRRKRVRFKQTKRKKEGSRICWLKKLLFGDQRCSKNREFEIVKIWNGAANGRKEGDFARPGFRKPAIKPKPDLLDTVSLEQKPSLPEPVSVAKLRTQSVECIDELRVSGLVTARLRELAKRECSTSEKRRSFTTDDIDIVKSDGSIDMIVKRLSEVEESDETSEEGPKPKPLPKPAFLKKTSSEGSTSAGQTEEFMKLQWRITSSMREKLEKSPDRDLIPDNHKNLSNAYSLEKQVEENYDLYNENQNSVVKQGSCPEYDLYDNASNLYTYAKCDNHDKMYRPPVCNNVTRATIDYKIANFPPPMTSTPKNVPDAHGLYACSNIVDNDQRRQSPARSIGDCESINSEDGSLFDSDSDEQYESNLANSSAGLSAMQRCLQEIDEAGSDMSKLKKKAFELLITERAYVEKLRLISQTFCGEIEAANKKHRYFPDEVISQMFSNIGSIYTLHHDHLLPQLEDRWKIWEKEESKIGDIMKTFAPFLKIYSEYVKNYDKGTTLLMSWYQKCLPFKEMLDSIQMKPECGKLGVQHHMLEPIQRVPRYRLLLEEYLRYLPEDSPDRAATQQALDLVSTAAAHSNQAMKQIEKFSKLMEIYEKIGGAVDDLVNPTRDIIKEGKIMKVSARNGQRMERYIFLFNDLILVCQEQAISLNGAMYKLKSKLSVEGMKIYEGDNQDLPNTIVVKTREKVLELDCGDSDDEKLAWMKILWEVVSEYRKRKLSLRKSEGILYDTGISAGDVGKSAPRWIKDASASMCMVCCTTFSTFRRRHHCRACGILACAKCSAYKCTLSYDGNIHRVCKKCYNLIEAGGNVEEEKKKGIKDVKGDEKSVVSGYLLYNVDGGKSWIRRWFAVHKDFVLYAFKARQDVAAEWVLPLPGRIIEERPDLVFHLKHPSKSYFFQADDEKVKNKWMNVLKRVVAAELPDNIDPT